VVAVPLRDTVLQKVKGDVRFLINLSIQLPRGGCEGGVPDANGRQGHGSIGTSTRGATLRLPARPARAGFFCEAARRRIDRAAALIINAIPLAGPAWARRQWRAHGRIRGQRAGPCGRQRTITVNAHDALVDWTATDAGGCLRPPATR
jgi:hypothetical protein